MRAALQNLTQWVVEGKQPPSSRHPRIDDSTGVKREVVLNWFKENTSLNTLATDALAHIYHPLLNPEADLGIVHQPVTLGPIRQAIVSAVDSDGNEAAGIRMPDISVPVGTHTGWNLRPVESGGEGQMIQFMGFTQLFTNEDIMGRYQNRENYQIEVQAAAETLAEEGYLLTEDVARVVENCMARFDLAVDA